MEQYIDKAAVLAEIDDWRDKIIKGIATIPLKGRQRADAALEYEILGKIRDFLDTLEVVEIGVDIGSPEGDIGVKTIWHGDKIVSNKVQKGE